MPKLLRKKAPEEPEKVLEQIELQYPDPQAGHTAAMAERLLENGYGNGAVASNAKTTGQIIREHTLTFFNMVFVVLAVLLIIVGEVKEMTFLIIAVANALIGIVQQLRSRATLEKLNLLDKL